MPGKIDDQGRPVIMTRKDARAAGFGWYFTGKPCVHNHLYYRRVSDKGGGSNDRRNLQLTCDTCNMRKKAVDPIDFARSTGRLI